MPAVCPNPTTPTERKDNEKIYFDYGSHSSGRVPFRYILRTGNRDKDFNLPTKAPSRPTPVPKLSPPNPVELDDARSIAYIDYEWAGQGNSGTMSVTITNKTDVPVIAHGGLGTKLEPGNGNVQSMVVTKEFEVELEAKEKKEEDVEVACLDIKKAAPGSDNVSWKVSASPRLAKFIDCVNGLVDDKRELQPVLWEARGATIQNWFEYFSKHRNLPDEQARENAESTHQKYSPIVQQCGSL